MPDIKTITRRKAGAQPVARARCDEIGIDSVCDMIVSGVTMTQISDDLGVSLNRLLTWIEDDPARSARAREARVRSARFWDEKAARVIEAAPDKFELERARELAHHYRWRAKAIAPRDYGDKVTQEHTGAGGGPIAIAAVDLRNLTDAELENMQMLMVKASGST